MGKQRFFIRGVGPSSKEIIFPENISYQIRRVLRCKVGDCVTVLNGDGKKFQVELVEVSSEKAAGKITGVGEMKRHLNLFLHLFFPLSKKEKVEWILQKGTEIGVAAFHPFTSQRSLIQSTSLKEGKMSRWKTIIREAAEQSGRVRLPKLHKPEQLEGIAHENAAFLDIALAAWVGEGERTIKTTLSGKMEFLRKKDKLPTIGIFVGPEGGFSGSEIMLLKQSGLLTVSLGPHILRMETAAIVFSALIVHELNDQFVLK